MANQFAKLPKILHSLAAEKLGKVKECILNKTTLRCIGYQKATILLSSALRKIDADTNIVRLVDTAVELFKSSIQRQAIGHHVAFYDCITSLMSMESFVLPHFLKLGVLPHGECSATTSIHSFATVP